jgi:hypothetical protein
MEAGNPLFMEKLPHSLPENGSIQMKGKQYEPVPRAQKGSTY